MVTNPRGFSDRGNGEGAVRCCADSVRWLMLSSWSVVGANIALT